MKKLFHLTMITVIMGILFISCEPTTGTDDSGGSAESQSLYKAGTYTATASGFGGNLILTVTFTSNEITEIEILDHKESVDMYDFIQGAIDDLPGIIVGAQSTEVDVVSRATRTSNAIFAAVDDAIAQAKDAL